MGTCEWEYNDLLNWFHIYYSRAKNYWLNFNFVDLRIFVLTGDSFFLLHFLGELAITLDLVQ